jgi:hypothetical protein
VTVHSKFPPRVRQAVEELAVERKWSLSRAILHLTECGLTQIRRERETA